MKLCPSIRHAIAQPPTRNIDAWDAYLKGRYHLSRLMPADIEESIRQLKLSVEKDPEFASAHAALAEAYGHVLSYAPQNRAGIFSLAGRALSTALSLNPNLPEARALSAISQVFRYNWAAAEREFSTALELVPNSPGVLTRRAKWFLTPQGRTSEALADVDLALESDPLSTTVIMVRAMIFWYGRQFERCDEECERMLSLYPNYVVAHWCKAALKLQMGRAGEGVAMIERMTEESEPNPLFLTCLATAYAKAGDRGRALEILRDLGEGDDCTAPSCYVADVYAALEDADKTVKCLERSVAEHDPNVVFLAVHPQFDCIRNHPRYGALLNSIGLGHMAGRPNG
ncbi:MAG: tetratricopeptide repeat protein [Bryobacteraceae bacterium]